MTLALLAWVMPLGLAPSAALQAAPEPIAIVGGEAAGQCVWPTTVAVETNGGLCTGSLVHPSLVVYAAHCGASNPRVSLGQHADAPAIQADVATCETNPDYLGGSDAAHDWAYCRLATPIEGVPITPPLYGCERDAIVAGTPVVIAGFGQSGSGMGSGPKRWAHTEIVSTFGATATIGEPSASTCAGDSGGSAFLALGDGGWRAISMVSAGVDCQSAVHALMHAAVPWIEAQSGIDITPCHTIDGQWEPGPDCGDFYAGSPTDEAQWSDGCQGLPRTGASETCGTAYDPGAGQDDDGQAGTDGGSDDGESDGDGDEATGGRDTGTEAEDAGDGSAASSDDATAASHDEARSGGCTVGVRPDALPLAWLAWLGLTSTQRRRRTPRIARV